MIGRRTLLALAPAVIASASAKPAKHTGGKLIVDVDRQPDEVFDLWPGAAPGGENVSLKEHVVERTNPYGLPDHAWHEVTRPTLSLFRAKDPDGSAILLIPGGGYGWVVIEKEGFESARLFSGKGAAVFVLKYRLPYQGWSARPDTPLQDAQRAIRLIRARKEIDPSRVAVLGFSAGGHLAGSLAMRFDAKTYEVVDGADALNARPDAVALIYPVVTMREPHRHKDSRTRLIGAEPSEEMIAKYSVESMARDDAPPVFLMHTADDPSVPVQNSLLLFEALQEIGANPSLHIFEKGGHGFGVRGLDDNPARVWPGLFMDFGAAHGIFRS